MAETPNDPILLDVRGLTIAARLQGQEFIAVDNISFALPAGRTWGSSASRDQASPSPRAH